jgi:opacity protein-like surface antigen
MKYRLATALLTLAFAGSAQATNWVQLQGGEVPDAPAFRYFGFVQPTYTHIDAQPVTTLQGAAAAHNGKYSALNLNWPNLESPHQFQILRAGLGARGRLTDEINYLVALDAGQNGTTYYSDVMLTDASLTFSFIPGARVRAGLFKLPTSEEALMAVNTSAPYVYNSNAVLYLLVGLPVQSSGAVNPAGASAANLTSGFSGYRDWGVQVYDTFNRGQWEYSYAAMLSNGDSIDRMLDSDGRKDLTLRFQTSYLLGGKGPNREDVSAYVWRQSGSRLFGTQQYALVREGVGLKYLQGDYRVSAEYLRAAGMIVGGQTPPFVGQPFVVGVNEKAGGWYLEGGWRFLPQWEVDLRYDYLDFMKQTIANEREFATITLGLQYFFNPATHVIFNYEWRDMTVTNPTAIPAGALRNNAETIASNVGDRASAQLTWSF